MADRDRYVCEVPRIRPPDAIVVSGDLIQGVRINTPDWENEITQQYEVCHDFLVALTDRFLAGDRSKVVLVPGNHDVAWPIAAASMEVVDDAALRLDPASFGPKREHRWDWEKRQLYRIKNRIRYNERFDFYRSFVARFYHDVPLAYPIAADSHFQLFELAEGRIVVAGFNSCFGNDCFAFHGCIPDSAIAEAHLLLRAREAQYELKMAVWHHNVEGAPYVSDYMDIDSVYRMIGGGFRLGLHGHQHRSDIGQRVIRIPAQEPMLVVSAGSLCAGPRDLPTGVNRQYNVIELDDTFTSACVHIREIAVSSVFGQARRTELGGHSFVKFDLSASPPTGASNRATATDAREANAVAAAERFSAMANYSAAVDQLLPWAKQSGYPRTLMVDALNKGLLWDRLHTLVSPPLAIGELLLLVDAFCRLKRFDDAEATLEEFAEPLEVSTPQRIQKQREILTRRTLSK